MGAEAIVAFSFSLSLYSWGKRGEGGATLNGSLYCAVGRRTRVYESKDGLEGENRQWLFNKTDIE